MGFFTDWLDRMFKASWERQQRKNKEERMFNSPTVSIDHDPDFMQSKTFTVRDALNGKYIQFRKHKYNPNGPDTNEQCVYIVRDNESLIDAISVVLVLMDKES